MNQQKTISFFCAVTVFFFAANCLAKSNDFSAKPAVPSSKVKITAPSPAPPVLVAPTKTKAPVSQPAVSTRTPKPAPPKVSVKQPKPSTPKVSVKKPRLSAPKPVTAPASLPPSIGRRGLPRAHIPKDLGKAVHIRRDLGQTNSIGGKLPGSIGEKLPGGRSTVAAGYAKGLGGLRTGAGSPKYDRSDLTGARIAQGSGEHIQGQETGENQKQPDEITFTEEEVAEDYATWEKTFEAVKEDIYVDPVFISKEEDEVAAYEADALLAPPPTKEEVDQAAHESEASKEPEVMDPQSERTADSGPGDGSHTGKGVNQKKLKAIFSGSPGIQFAPGEEGGEGGDINLGMLGEISSNQTQIHTFEGGVPKSVNFEDLSKQAQDTIKAGGYSTRSD